MLYIIFLPTVSSEFNRYQLLSLPTPPLLIVHRQQRSYRTFLSYLRRGLQILLHTFGWRDTQLVRLVWDKKEREYEYIHVCAYFLRYGRIITSAVYHEKKVYIRAQIPVENTKSPNFLRLEQHPTFPLFDKQRPFLT